MPEIDLSLYELTIIKNIIKNYIEALKIMKMPPVFQKEGLEIIEKIDFVLDEYVK